MDYVIFEDDERDDIQRLIKQSYTNTDHILWTQGSANIKNEIIKHGLNNTYYIFMDLVPDNIETYKAYRKISALVNIGYKIIIFPIPCAEFYMLKALIELNLLEITDRIKEIIKKIRVL